MLHIDLYACLLMNMGDTNMHTCAGAKTFQRKKLEQFYFLPLSEDI